MELRLFWQITELLLIICMQYAWCQIETPDVHVRGGRYHGSYTNKDLCLWACEMEGTSKCAGVDYEDAGGCWFHNPDTNCGDKLHLTGVAHISLVSCYEVQQPINSVLQPQSPNIRNIISQWKMRHARGGRRIGFMGPQSCVNSCSDLPNCFAVDWDERDQSCWVHMRSTACGRLLFERATTHYVVRPCDLVNSIFQAAPSSDHQSNALVPMVHESKPESFSSQLFTCGNPTVSPIGSRIVGGVEAIPGSWPWQCALRHKDEGVVRCGAALIDHQWILTTSHCVDEDSNPHKWHVLCGCHDLQRSSECKEIVTVAKIIYHSGFDLKTYDNDIALLKLSRPVSYSDYVSPICLPQQDRDVTPGTVCTVTGWGNPGQTKRPLKQANLPIVSQSTCRSRDWLGRQFHISDRMMCAGYERGRIDSCQGDSGGPLVCFEGNSFFQYGVTSFGRGCGLPKKPGVYTRVSKFVNWIKSNMLKYS